VDQHPISQTPSQALRSGFFIFNYVISIIGTFFVNYGFAVLILMKNDRVALWNSPGILVINDKRVYYSNTPLWSDLLLTCILITFVVSLISTPGLRKALMQAKTLPIPQAELRPYRFFGVTVTYTFGRCILFTILATATIYPAILGCLEASCKNGTMPKFGNDFYATECYFDAAKYKWFKAGFCGIICTIVYPLVFLAALNRNTLSDEEYTQFLEANSSRIALNTGSTIDSGHHANHVVAI